VSAPVLAAFTVNAALTSKRSRRRVENDDYVPFVRRIIRALGRRVGAGDVETLPRLAELSAELDAVIADAVLGLRAEGYSWAEIGARLGVSKQACQQRWGRP
jgi:DNA-directed RNA polymerase specialized sigma24 family protein